MGAGDTTATESALPASKNSSAATNSESPASPGTESSTAAPPAAATISTSPTQHVDAVPNDENEILEADEIDDDDDNDSALGITESQLTSESLRSSIYHYQVENGRMYHALSQGKYVWPNDEEENDRLDVQHHHFLVTFDGKRYHCPAADSAKRVLDIGTGTGIWAIEYADEHPDATVLGVDLSPIQPSFVPPNCQFEVDDLEKDWTWSQPFDFIFSRMMIGSFADWNRAYEQMWTNLTPGGWVEVVDNVFPCVSDDGTTKEDQHLMQWMSLLIEASKNLGRDLEDSKLHKQRLIEAGFVNVTQKVYKWPSNPWPKDKKHKQVGLWTIANIEAGLEGLSMALLTRGLGWTKEEVIPFLAGVRKDMRDHRIHAYWPILVTYAQKPETDMEGS